MSNLRSSTAPCGLPTPQRQAASLRALGLWLAGACALGLGSCAEVAEAEATTTHLAAELELDRTTPTTARGTWVVRGAEDGSWTEVHQALEPAQITSAGFPGLLAYPIALTGHDQSGGSPLDQAQLEIEGAHLPAVGGDTVAPNRLFQDGRELTEVTWHDQLDIAAAVQPGHFATVAGVLYLMPFEGDAAHEFEFVARFPNLRESNEAGGHQHVDLGGHSIHGVSMASGDAFTTEVLYEDGAELMFATASRGVINGQVPLELLLDGTVIWSQQLTTSFEPGLFDSWRIELPPSAKAQELTLRVPMPPAGASQGLGLVHVLRPTFTQPSKLSAAPEKPDIVVFLADTFRADNLAKSGGNPRIAPHINDFVDQAVYFPSAWSPASWTLPSQASLLTSLSPGRHGAVMDLLSLDERLTTLPELLSRAGYRTVAITEGGFMVPTFGLDQGFETFLVGEPLDIATTLERVRQVLGEDDGRPLFLYVQTFRAHTEYIASDTALAQLPELFGQQPAPADWTFKSVVQDIYQRHGNRSLHSDDTNARLPLEVVEDLGLGRLASLYRGGAYDTSVGFGEFLSLLEDAGLGDAPTFFTSDHGEAFGEHRIVGHANNCYDETLRIPMAIRAPGVRPRSSTAPVTLLDLGPTICELADIGVPGDWEGRSLVSLLADDTDADPERRLVSLECPSTQDLLPAEFAVHQGKYKLLGSLDAEGLLLPGSLVGYDLETDPGELSPVTDGAAWLTELGLGLEAELAALQKSLYPPQQVSLSGEAAERLAEMGYMGH